MTIRPSLVPSTLQKETRLRQIRPITVWTTLTQVQQTAVLQEFVTMCQECLLPAEEATNDPATALAENHANPS
jgi:hypothetical protein